MSAPGRGRRSRVIVGLLVVIVGLVGAVVLWLAASARLDSGVDGLARAPVGCDTVLDFDDTGDYLIFVETRGSLGDDVRGDCVAPDDVDRNSGALPEVTVTVSDPDGAELAVETDDGVDYDTDSAAGASIGRITVEQAGDHLIRVEADDDDFYVSIGHDPTQGVTVMRIGAIAAAVAAVVIGLALIVTGRRRGPVPAESDPNWSPGPAVAPFPSSPPGFPAPPPTTGVTGVVGPPTGPPVVRPTSALPTPPSATPLSTEQPEPPRWGPPTVSGS